MIIYWAMYGFPALFALVSQSKNRVLNTLDKFGLVLIFLLFTILLGLRFEVGADWFNYESILYQVAIEDLATAMSYGDPGFSLVAWIATHIGADVYGANLLCGIALITGLIMYCRQQDQVWLALAASVPYLVIVVGMGYVRQGAAIGFVLLALTYFERGSLPKTIGAILVAGLFHASAVCVAPLVGLAFVRKRPILIIPGAIASVGLFLLLLQERLDVFYSNYVEAEYDSSGALVRLLMNAVPASLFLAYRKRFSTSPPSRVLYLLFSSLSLVLVAAVAVSPSTTLLDRLGLYLIPIQIYVFGNLAKAMDLQNKGRFGMTVVAVGYYAAILFVWLTYATHSEYWVPYRFLPFET